MVRTIKPNQNPNPKKSYLNIVLDKRRKKETYIFGMAAQPVLYRVLCYCREMFKYQARIGKQI